MKTVAQWAEQLPELIRIEFLKEAEKQKTDIDAVLDINYSAFSQSLFFHITEIDKWFWYGLRDNEYVNPTSADYLDESVPYTKEEVEAMILEYADPNDEVCKVMLANVMTKAYFPESEIMDVGKTKEATLANQLTYEALSLSNKNLIIEIGEITKENEALKSTIEGLNAIVETHKVEIESLHKVINVKDDRIKELRTEVYDLENNNHELLEKTKPTPQRKPTLLDRFLNWFK